jgi:hypothetical protein
MSAMFVYLYNDLSHQTQIKYRGEAWKKLVKDWFTGSGSKSRVYGPEHELTQQLMKDPAVKYFKEKFLKTHSLGDAKYYAVKFGVTDFFTSNSDALDIVGSYGLSIYYSGPNKLTFLITNDMSFTSFTAGIGPSWDTGPMSTIETNFWWEESIK